MNTTLVLIGGGDLKAKETLEIDKYIASLALEKSNSRPIALFVGTASHDSMPYYNTFHKTYCGVLGLKTECALSVYGEMSAQKLDEKFAKADMVYISGGDTMFMLNSWEKSGMLKRILNAYSKGVIMSGLSAGAIFWGEQMFTDSAENTKYSLQNGIGIIPYGICPHYNLRRKDFLSANPKGRWLCIEDNAAVVLKNGALAGAISDFANAFLYINDADGKRETKISLLNK